MPELTVFGFSGEAVSMGNAFTGRGGLVDGQDLMNGAASV